MTLEFLFGAAAGWLIKSGRTGWAGPALALGCAGFLAALLVVDFTSLEDSLPILRTFTFGPASALIVYAVAALELEHKPLPWAHARLVQLGDWSYSLYLCHILVISAVARLFFPIFGRHRRHHRRGGGVYAVREAAPDACTCRPQAPVRHIGETTELIVPPQPHRQIQTMHCASPLAGARAPDEASHDQA